MTRTGTVGGSLIKSAMLWLTVGVMMASVYGAVLAVSHDQHPQILFAQSEPAPIITASNGYSTETHADR